MRSWHILSCKHAVLVALAATSGIGHPPKDEPYASGGASSESGMSDLRFHHPKGASLDTVDVASPTACARLSIPHECFSPCSRSYSLVSHPGLAATWSGITSRSWCVSFSYLIHVAYINQCTPSIASCSRCSFTRSIPLEHRVTKTWSPPASW